MEKIDSLAQYQQLRKDVQNKYRKVTTNNYMFPQQVERYICLGRLYAEVLEAGVVFYTDEETHYKAYFSVSSKVPFGICRKDKPVYFRNIYIENKKPDDLIEVEQSLRTSEVKKLHTTTYVYVDPEKGLEALNRTLKVSRRLMEEEGLSIIRLPKERLPEFLALHNQMEMIPFYELSYHTQEEWYEEIDLGHVLCVVNSENKICALKHTYEESSSQSGWIYIKPQYQKQFGLSAVLTASALQYGVDHNIKKVYGWILEDNFESIKYHKRLGYVWSNRVSDEWLLEKGE